MHVVYNYFFLKKSYNSICLMNLSKQTIVFAATTVADLTLQIFNLILN